MLEHFNNYEHFRILIYVFTFIFGLFMGSFFNVVALRLLKEESIVFPGSHCPKCNHPIRFYDNIPVLSYILLMGKCRDCKAHISIQYPLVEFATGFLYFFSVYSFGLSIQSAGMMLLISALIILIITDLHEQYIFDVTSISLIPFGLVYNFFRFDNFNRPDLILSVMPKDTDLNIQGYFVNGSLHIPGMFVSAVIGIIIAIVFFEGLSYLSEVTLGKPGFGMGDTKLCAGLASWFGWELLIVIIAISILAQVIVGLPILMYNMCKEGDKKSLIATIIMIIATAIPMILNFIHFNNSISLVIVLVCLIIVSVCLLIMLKNIREKESCLYLPLGPAIAFGAFIVIFYGKEILSVFLH